MSAVPTVTTEEKPAGAKASAAKKLADMIDLARRLAAERERKAMEEEGEAREQPPG